MPDIDLPNTVATKTFLAQTSSLVNAVVFTPTVAGLFRVSGYLEASSGTVGPAVTINWTDDNRSQTGGAVISQITAGFQWNGGSPVTIRVAANTNILVSVSLGSGTLTYDLYVVVEQME